MTPYECPNCNADLFDGIRTDDGARLTRCIGIYSLERDITIAWRCPDCNHEWPRFPAAKESLDPNLPQTSTKEQG